MAGDWYETAYAPIDIAEERWENRQPRSEERYDVYPSSHHENNLAISPPRQDYMACQSKLGNAPDIVMLECAKEGESGQNWKEEGGMHMELSENDKRFYSPEELLKLEPIFDQRFSVGTGGGQPSQTHVLLSPLEYRAKFYWLDQENRWIDIGTGRFRILLSKDNIEHYI